MGSSTILRPPSVAAVARSLSVQVTTASIFRGLASARGSRSAALTTNQAPDIDAINAFADEDRDSFAESQ